MYRTAKKTLRVKKCLRVPWWRYCVKCRKEFRWEYCWTLDPWKYSKYSHTSFVCIPCAPSAVVADNII